MITPDEVDLLTGSEPIADQGSTQMCKAFAYTELIDTMAQRAGSPRGHSAWFLARKAKGEQGLGYGDVPMSHDAIRSALIGHGICMIEDFDIGQDMSAEPGLTPNLKALLKAPIVCELMPFFNDDTIASIERSVCFGRPPSIDINLPFGFHSAIGNNGWRSHNWSAGSDRRHQMTIVGYSKSARRFKAKNSEGTSVGDEGYVGIPYDMVLHGPQYSLNSLHIITKSPYPPQKVSGFMPGVPTLSGSECRDFTHLNKASRVAALGNALAVGGWLGVRDKCIELGISDKLIEEDFGLQRGEAQGWFTANNIPQGSMIWLDIV